MEKKYVYVVLNETGNSVNRIYEGTEEQRLKMLRYVKFMATRGRMLPWFRRELAEQEEV